MQVHQITQISESHCGPAVLQMLLETLDVNTSQKEIAKAALVENTIEEQGMRVDQIATACNRIAPHLVFWYKYYSSLQDIKYLLEKNIAVGVEWQGLFYNSIEEEQKESEGEGDYGHYSVIAFFDEELEQVVIVDPYKDFTNQSRIFSLQTFLERWWDINEVDRNNTGKKELVKDTRLLFFVTHSNENFPEEMRFKQFNGV